MNQENDNKTSNLKKYLNTLKWLVGLSLAVGTIIPGLTSFTSLSPPLFKEIGFVASGIAILVIITIYYYEPNKKTNNSGIPFLINRGVKSIIISVVLIIVYTVLLKLCTVESPLANDPNRIQIGFYKLEWSLSDSGKTFVNDHPDKNPSELLDYDTAYNKVHKYWKPWTIYTAGILLIITFLFLFISWIIGWCFLAKHIAKESNISSIKTE